MIIALAILIYFACYIPLALWHLYRDAGLRGLAKGLAKVGTGFGASWLLLRLLTGR